MLDRRGFLAAGAALVAAPAVPSASRASVGAADYGSMLIADNPAAAGLNTRIIEHAIKGTTLTLPRGVYYFNTIRT